MRVLSPDLSFILRGIKRSAVLLSALSIVGAICEVFLLSALVQSIEALRDGHSTLRLHYGPVHFSGNISVLLSVAVAAALLRAGVAATVAVLGPRIAARTRARQRRMIYAAYMRADWETQSNEKTGRLMQTFSSSVNDATSLVLLVAQSVPAVFTLGVVLLVALVLDPLVTLSIAAIGLGTTLALAPLSRRAGQAAKLDSRGRNATAAHVSGSLVAGAEISVMGARRGIIRDAHLRIDRTEHQFGRSQGIKRLIAVAGQSLTFILAAAGVWVLSVTDAHVDYTVVGTIAILMLRAAGLVQQIQSTFSQYGTVRPFIEQVRTMIEKYDASRPVFGDQPFPDDFSIDLQDVSYTYPGNSTPALSVSRLNLPARSFVGVMGPSGAGKSTLIQVLLRLRRPDQGVVRIGGLAASDISDEAFSHNVAYVPQTPHLLTGTVMDNILFYRDWLQEEDAVEAARLVNLHDEIMELPQGYNTSMEGHVAPLSGGQKQRLSLARAIASRPRLLVLDEPTSALDADNEQVVLSVLARLRGSVTVVMITHKVAAVDRCDRVYVVDQGVLADAPFPGRQADPPTDEVGYAADAPR